MREIHINPSELVFSNKVRESCRQCKNYGFKATCPPNIEDVDYYKKLLLSYKFGIIYIKQFTVNDPKNWKKLGKQSSLELQKILIKKREYLLKQGHYFAIILGGGSCKVCKKCIIPCRHPELSIIPIEATGVDVVASLKNKNLEIKFPVKSKFYRVGAIFYD